MLSTGRLVCSLFHVCFLALLLRHSIADNTSVAETFQRFKRLVTGHFVGDVYSNALYENADDDFKSKGLSSVYWHKALKWPWMVRLHFNGKKNKRCGGALIARNIVLTAAHCVDGVAPSSIKVHVGDYHVNNVDDGEDVYDVVEVIVNPFHRSYVQIFRNCGTQPQRGEIDLHDVAVVVLNGNIVCNDLNNILLLPWRSLNLSYYSRRFPSPRSLQSFRECHVAGWGATYHLGPFSNVLLDTKVHILPMSLCNSTCFYEGKLMQGMLCAGDPTGGGRDACQGDSGGPLMCKYNETWYLVGIVSWGFRCGDKFKPGIYTDVAAYQNWILKELDRRPRLEASFWNSLLHCKSRDVRLKECRHDRQRYFLKQRGIKCPRHTYT